MPEQDLTQVNTDKENLENQENQEQQENQENQENQSQQTQQTQQIDWEAEDNPYKKRYGDSQSQVQPLVRELQNYAEFDHNSRTWKPKSATPPVESEDFDKLLDGYDPEFKKAVGGFVSKQIKDSLDGYRKETDSVQEYNSSVTTSRSKAMEEFGTEFEFVKNGQMNNLSPLYKLADEIVINKYSVFNPDGTFIKYSNSDAEYLSTVEAYAILAKRAKVGNPEKAKLGAIQGKGTKLSAVKKELSYEDYNKLSNSEKDAYDLTQMGG